MRVKPSVHVVRGIAGGAALKTALRGAGLAERVLVSRDALEVGPLWDLECGGASRNAFWDAVALRRTDRAEERQAWSTIRSASAVTVWHGEHPGEYLMLLRVAALRLDSAQELYQVVWSHEGRDDVDARQPALVGARPDRIVSLLSARVPVPDRAALAQEWEVVAASRDAMFRRLAAGKILDLPITAYDEPVLLGCRHGWTPAVRVISAIVTKYAVGDAVIGWRIRGLVEARILEGRGQGHYGPAEIRSSVG